MEIKSWTMDDLVGRDVYERLLARLGADDLGLLEAQQRVAGQQLQATLAREQQALFLVYADAASDRAASREEGGARAGLCLGVGIGAALARFPEHPPEDLLATAATTVGAVLGADLPLGVAEAVARAALGALARSRASARPLL